ncbi:MAG: hypothetical protein AB7E85_03185 [Pseudobdellovibrionaceae bacterium]
MRKLSLALALAVAPLSACNEAPQEPAAPAVDTRTPEEKFEGMQTSAGIACNVNADVRKAIEAERTASTAYYADNSRANWDAREAAKQDVADARQTCLAQYYEDAGVGDVYRARQAAPQAPAAN